MRTSDCEFLGKSEENLAQLVAANEAVADLALDALVRGFHGEINVRLLIQDGTIQVIETVASRKLRRRRRSVE